MNFRDDKCNTNNTYKHPRVCVLSVYAYTSVFICERAVASVDNFCIPHNSGKMFYVSNVSPLLNQYELN